MLRELQKAEIQLLKCNLWEMKMVVNKEWKKELADLETIFGHILFFLIFIESLCFCFLRKEVI